MWGFPVWEREFHCIWSVCKETYFAVKAVNSYGDWITGETIYVLVIVIKKKKKIIFKLLKSLVEGDLLSVKSFKAIASVRK